MKKSLYILFVVLLGLSFVSPLSAQTYVGTAGRYGEPGEKPSADAVLADVMIVRPFSIAGYLAGLAVAIVATPLALPSGSVGTVWKTLVVDSAEYAFARPMGVGF